LWGLDKGNGQERKTYNSFTWSKSGLLKLWVVTPIGSRTVILGSRNTLAWQIRYRSFCKLYKKIQSRPAVNLFLLHF